MPRASLPVEMKKFSSFEVLVTVTKEEEVWEHINSAMNEFEDKSNEMFFAKNSFINQQYDINPYRNESFKQEVDKLSPHDWIKDEYHDIMKRYAKLKRDMELCSKVMWTEEEDEEKNSMLLEWIFEIEKFMATIHDNDEFVIINNMNYRNALQDWRKKNSKYIEQRNEAIIHQFCSYTDLYAEPHVEGEHYYLKGETREYFNKNCRICIQRKQSYYDELEYSKRMEIENAERDAKYRAEVEKKREEERLKEEERKKTLPTYECKDCNYTTKYYGEYQAHLETKEHINITNLKKWYCPHCKVQPRNLTEYMFHTTTKKHKIAVGELEADPTEYHCEKCNYRTDIKQNWEKHLKSKKHNDEKV